MAENFRSAFNGFNREDVVHYLEYLNNKHNVQVGTLNAQIQQFQQELEAAPKAQAFQALHEQVESLNAQAEQLREELTRVKAEKQALEEKLAAAEKNPSAAPSAAQQTRTDEELEAYRRAERTERMARERAEAICGQANTILSDATNKVDAAAQDVNKATEDVRGYLDSLEAALGATRQALKDAAASMYNLNL